MALQIRRGPTADRMSYTPVVGELVWDTSTNSLYIGNGTTTGGLPAGTLVTEDVQDIASTMLTSGTHQNITFTYDDTLGRINSTFNLSSFDGVIDAAGFKGSVYAADSTLMVNALTGAVNLNGTVKGHVIPSTDIAYDLGSASYRFRDLYLSGSSIKLGSATITATGSTVNLPVGSTVGGITLGSGVESGMNYNINLVGDDSTVIINARTKSISAASLSVVNTLAGDSITGRTLALATNTYSLAAFPAFKLSQHHATADAVNFTFIRTRGTSLVPTAVQNGDDLADIVFSGHDGTAILSGATLSVIVDGVPTLNNLPTKFSFLTNNGSATAARAELSATGIWKVDTVQALTANTALSFGGMAKLKSYADETAANAAVGGTPANGMMYYDTALSKIRGYQGGAWVNFA